MFTGSVPAAFSPPEHNRLLLNFECHQQTDDYGLRWIMKCLKHRWACKSFLFLRIPSDIKVNVINTVLYPHDGISVALLLNCYLDLSLGKKITAWQMFCAVSHLVGERLPSNLYQKEVGKVNLGSSHCGPAVMSRTNIHEVASSIPDLIQWVKDLVLPWAVV